MKIVVVEDEAISAMSLRQMLLELGHHTCLLAASGEEAIRICLEEKPELIIMDVNLSGTMDGVEAAEVILVHHKARVLFISGYPTSELRERLSHLEPVDFLEKPVSAGDVSRALRDF